MQQNHIAEKNENRERERERDTHTHTHTGGANDETYYSNLSPSIVDKVSERAADNPLSVAKEMTHHD